MNHELQRDAKTVWCDRCLSMWPIGFEPTSAMLAASTERAPHQPSRPDPDTVGVRELPEEGA